MPIEYDYDQNLTIVYSHPSGNISTAEIVTYFNDVAGDDLISNGFLEVVHFEKSENFTFSSDQAANIAMAFNEIREKKGVNSTVFMATSEMQYGIGRVFQAFIKFYCPGHGVLVVRSEEEI
jgi:hypothetical protein